MSARCENPVLDALLQHPKVKTILKPRCDEMDALKAKGIDKTLDDLMRIREIRDEIEDLLSQVLERAVIVDLGASSDTENTALNRESMVKLTNVYTDSQSFATCDAGMFTTPWSRGFVHGADSALHVGDLAQKILKPGERIAGMKRITWRRPTTTNLKLAVYARSFPGIDVSDYNFDGELLTSDGRSLMFFAMADEQSQISTHMAEPNPFATNMLLCLCEECVKFTGGTTVYRLQELPSGLAGILDEDASLRMSTTLELLTLGIAHSRSKEATDRSNVLKLLAGVNDLVLPASAQEICGKLAIRVFADASKRGKSGMELIPFEYRFPFMTKDGSGIVAVTQSVYCADDVLDGVRKGVPRKGRRGRR